MSGSATVMTEAEVARERVKRGVVWLDEKAKKDPRFVPWRLMLFNIYEGRISCLVKVEFNTRDPISLILREHAGFACPSDGRVKWAVVSKAFFRTKHDGDPIELGFDSGRGVSPEMLNAAWADILSSYHVQTDIRHFF